MAAHAGPHDTRKITLTRVSSATAFQPNAIDDAELAATLQPAGMSPMTEERRSHCLAHLREACLCLDDTGHAVLAARLQDIIGALEQGE